MKYIVVIGDGMADYPIGELGNKTALQAADKPAIDDLACRGIVGRARTIPTGMPAGSDTANLSVMGYDPRQYHNGRSPFEAASIGVEMKPDDLSFRCNLVTLSSGESYAEKTMLDYSAGEITSEEARQLIAVINEQNSAAGVKFYPGLSYRHLMIWPAGPSGWQLTPPHDIIGRRIEPYLPAGNPHSAIIREMMIQSCAVLRGHPVNRDRVVRGLKPANSIWLWGEGRRPQLPVFYEKYGLKGAVISAVDLIKGIGIYAGLELIEVEGATGDFHTNYSGKAEAALEALRRGLDFVYIHIAAPDECSHQYEIGNKVKSIELIDRRIVRLLVDGLNKMDEAYKILIMPDHYTPLALRTHTADPVPFLIYESNGGHYKPGRTYDEASAEASNLFFEQGHTLMDFFLGAQNAKRAISSAEETD
jgi:2,3-bisphosphoglycerate-independent phosphoglycerate mutase